MKNMHALSFTISPSQALEKFQKWADQEQGLQYLLRSSKISAAYCPVWCFDVNLRFVIQDEKTGRWRLDWKPSLFSVYGTQSVVHIPGLATYSGYNYPRSLINPIHNTALVFLGDNTVPFSPWMLKDLKNEQTGETIPIMPDPWNATRSRALHVLKQELAGIAQELPNQQKVEVQMEVVDAKRVYMPTYVVDYTLWGGVEYQAFVSGADTGAGVSGTSHELWGASDAKSATQGLQGFLSQTAAAMERGARSVGLQRLFYLLTFVFRLLSPVARLLLLRLPWIAALAGGFVGFRKFVRPFLGSRWTSAEWERQRDYEASFECDHQDDFVDPGSAVRFFRANKSRILRHFTGGEPEHQTGSYDFYKEWEDWARKMYQQQQYQQQQYYQQQQQQQYQHRTAQRSQTKAEYQWDFNPDDPYSVLGTKRGASKQEISAAFRREMLKYHPDTQTNASEAERCRSTERSKLISEAYRKIKADMK